MLPIKQFPKLPEGLEAEIYYLYESTYRVGDYVDSGCSNYFTDSAETLGLEGSQAHSFDNLVDSLYADYEMIKTISSGGKHKPKRSVVEVDSFMNAMCGAYNDTSLVNSGFDGEVFGDYKVLEIIGNQILKATNPFIATFFGRETFKLVIPEGQAAIFRSLKKDALAALEKKLRFEAAIYEKMKAHHGIRVEFG